MKESKYYGYDVLYFVVVSLIFGICFGATLQKCDVQRQAKRHGVMNSDGEFRDLSDSSFCYDKSEHCQMCCDYTRD